MQRLSQLPAPPHFSIEVVRPRSPEEPGFLKYVSRHVRTVSKDGERSETLVYDEVDRPALDAVVVLPHFSSSKDGEMVVLRSAIRPPVALRDAARSPVDEPDNRGLWEIPAGLIEPGEEDEEGVRRAARRELLEETGFRVAPEAMRPLGPSTYPAPGVIAERQFFFHVRVDPEDREEPPLDGSPLEQAGRLVAVPLAAALDATRVGQLADAKTELALRRLQEVLDR